MANPVNRESDKVIARLPDGMRDRIKAAAAANNRSMNAEIVATLEEKYPPPPEAASERFAANMNEAIARLDAISENPDDLDFRLEQFKAIRASLEESLLALDEARPAGKPLIDPDD